MEPKDFISFDKMLTPIIVQVIFWIGVAISILLGLGMIVKGFASSFGGGILVFMGLVYLVVGPILTRVYCELLIIVFKIHDNLVDIRNSLREKAGDATEA